MYTKSLERLKGIVDPADKVPIEKFLSVENLRLAMALIFSLKINFYQSSCWSRRVRWGWKEDVEFRVQCRQGDGH